MGLKSKRFFSRPPYAYDYFIDLLLQSKCRYYNFQKKWIRIPQEEKCKRITNDIDTIDTISFVILLNFRYYKDLMNCQNIWDKPQI